ncbi:S8 family serine peptidase [Candidatus Pacearchaeota archaeon]|nr:S8 family serine peptidase [Candidatus Pacearchaeota archaeon]
MVYKKYIKRGSKTYGPYLYHSVKKDGKVITQYVGSHKEINFKDKKKNQFNFPKPNLRTLSVILGFIAVVLFIYFIFILQFGSTGKVSLDIQDVYSVGDKLSGNVGLILKHGELFPADTQLVFDNAGQLKQFSLRDLLAYNLTNGDLFVENKNVSGSGDGFGVQGQKEIYPDVSFSFKVISSLEILGNNTENKFNETNNVNESMNASENTTSNETASEEPTNFSEPPANQSSSTPQEPQTATNQGQAPNPSSPESETTPQITDAGSANPSPSDSSPATGQAISESIIDGLVSKNKPYEYQLNQGEIIQIISSSQPVKFEIKDGKVIVTTDYSQIQYGFGKDYLTNDTLYLSINLSQLNLSARTGNLKFSFVYNNEELISTSKKIKVLGFNNSLVLENATQLNVSNLTKIDKINAILADKEIKIDKHLIDELKAKDKVRAIIRTKPGFRTIGDKLSNFDNLEVVDLDEFNLDLLNSTNVSEAILDQPVSLLINESQNIIRSAQAKNQFGLSGQGKKICIIDTGVDGSVTSYSTGFDFVNNDSDASDDNGHGTQVAYIAKSVAPGSELIVTKVLDANGQGYESNVLEGLQYCINQGADIISFSIGSGSYDGFCDSNVVADLANRAVNRGIFVAAATGNDGSTNLKSPACASNVTRVSATDKQDAIASFSNVNLALDVFAPGKDISTKTLGGSVTSISGTSASVPFVSGSAALVLQNESLAPLNLRYRFASTGKPITYSQGNLTINISRLDVYNAVINNVTMIPYNETLNQANATNNTYAVLQIPPNTYLISPLDNVSGLNNITFKCNASDDISSSNLSLWGNWGNGWHRNATVYPINLSGNLLIYHFNNESAFGENNTRFYDFSNKGNNATGKAFDNNEIVAGKFNKSIYFDGNDSVETINTVDISNSSKITVSFWVNSSGAISSDYILAESSTDYNTNSNSWAVVFRSDKRIDFCLRGNSPAEYSCWTSSSSLTAGQWYHVVGVFDRSLGFGSESKGYINGVLDGTNTASTDSTTNFSNYKIYIGSRAGTSLNFTGTIDEFAIWNRTLSASEIDNLYNLGELNRGIYGSFNLFLSQGIYKWNCEANDNEGLIGFASSNRTVYVGQPAIVLQSPADNYVYSASSVSNANFSCNVSDGEGIANVSLYTNTTGTWTLNQTINLFSPIQNVSGNYNVSYLGNGIYRMTFQPNGTYGKDSYVHQGFPDTNYGDVDLFVHYNYYNLPFLEFNLTKLQEINKSIDILGSNLTLYNSYSTLGSGGSSYIFGVIQSWNESTITYNNRPSLGASYSYALINPSSFVTYDLTSLVKEWINGSSTNYGLEISPTTTFDHWAYLLSSETGGSTTRPKFVIDYQVKGNYTANFTINNVGQGFYTWSCFASDTNGNAGFAASNFTFTIDPCLPPVQGNWNVSQACVFTNRVLYLAGDSQLNINSSGNLTLINTTLWINGSSNGASNINVNSGGGINLTSNSGIKSVNSNKYGFIVNVGSNFSMTNSSLVFAVSLDLYGNVNNFTGNLINSSPVNLYTSNNIIKNSRFEASTLKLSSGDTQDSLNDLVDNNTFVSSGASASTLIIDPIGAGFGFASYNHTISNNLFNGSGTGNAISTTADSSSNLIENNTITGYARGILIVGGATISTNRFSNNTITNSTTTGISGSGGFIYNSIFYKNTLINNSLGLLLPISNNNNLFIDNVIINDTSNDINNSGSNNTFLNTTFNKSKVSVKAGFMTVKWYLDANVSTRLVAPVNQANVSAYNISNNLYFTQNTSASGFITRQNVTEYIQNVTGKFYSTNYTVNATKPGYSNYSTQLNITSSTLLNILMNSVPSLSNIIFNSSTGRNATYDDLTVYYSASDLDGDVVSVIPNWIFNGRSLTVLNMPFDTNISDNSTGKIKDYSGFGNNGTLGMGTLTTAPQWVNTGFFSGTGAYQFNRLEGDVINISDSNSLNVQNFTIEAWVRIDSLASKNTIVKKNNQYILRFENTPFNLLYGYLWTDTGVASITSANNFVPSGTFRHVALTYNGTYIALYVDGGLSNITGKTGLVNDSTNNLGIGGDSEILGEGFNGTIDNVRIWNRSLSAEEIYNIYYQGVVFNKDIRIMSSQETEIGDNWSVALTPNDNLVDGITYLTNNITIVNHAPNTIQVILNTSTGLNLSNESLNCYANITDAEDSFVYANYSWYNDTGLVLKGQTLIASNTLSFVANLSESYTKKYDNWTCSIQAYDGIVYEGDWNNATKLRVLNTPPIVFISSPPNFNVTTNRTPLFVWVGWDDDGSADIDSYTINITMYGGGGQICSDPDRSVVVNQPQQNYIPNPYLNCLSDDLYYYNWSVRAWDGDDYSPWTAPRRIDISSLVSVNLTRDKINFGLMLPTEINDTTDNNPQPLLMENIGNVPVNVTINATDLWTNPAFRNPSQYYRYKINNSLEIGSFNWLQSQTSWRNVTNSSTQELAISSLNWSDSNDSASIDIYIQVPKDEIAGVKSSLINFLATRSDS